MSPLRAAARRELLLWPLILHCLDELRQHVLTHRDQLDDLPPHQRVTYLAGQINRHVSPDTVALIAAAAILTSMEDYQARHHTPRRRLLLTARIWLRLRRRRHQPGVLL